MTDAEREAELAEYWREEAALKQTYARDAKTDRTR
jgi:hypothetical protein